MVKSENRNMFWQQMRGCTILAVVFIHCYNGLEFPLNSFNGASYFVLRNLMNFPVDVFFFMSGFFMKPVDDVAAFYKKRLPKLIVPYLFYTCVYLGLSMVFGNGVSIKGIVLAFVAGTASTPLYYIIVLTYFTLLAPFLMKAVHNRKISIIILLSTPIFITGSYVCSFAGIFTWDYLKYTPVWLSFYYLGMLLKIHKPVFKRTVLWTLLPVSFFSELFSTFMLMKDERFNAYTQMRFTGAFYSLMIILLAYEYSKEIRNNKKGKWLTKIGDDSYAIYYMHCACLIVFTRLIRFKDNMILPLYQLAEIVFAVIACEIVIYVIKKLFKNRKIQMTFGI